MKEKKSIDRIFQEKFKDFEADPPEKTWDQIASRLDKKKKKRPIIIPLWFKVGGVAAVIALIISSILFTNTNNPDQVEPGVVFENPSEIQTTTEDTLGKNNNRADSNSNQIAEENSSESESLKNSEDYSGSAITDSDKPEKSNRSKSNSNQSDVAIASVPEENTEKKLEKEEEVIQPEAASGLASDKIAEEAISDEKKEKESNKSILEQEEQNALAQLEESEKNKKEKTESEGSNSRKFRLSSFAAPVFYTNMGSGSQLSSQFANNSKSSEVSVSYGVKVAYAISDKIKVRTGISKLNVNQKTNDISFSPSAISHGMDNVQLNQENIEIRNNAGAGSSFNSDSSSMNSLSSSIYTPGAIDQQFGFIEIPLELEYSLIDKKFGLNIIGGASTLFLDDNRVSLVSGNSSTNIGEASNINSTSFSTNIGFGMDYQLNDRFSISLEPIFKYQLNTFNNVDQVQPANFGIYSGINFKL
ncbi:hypothetical protein E0K83_05385 [Gramella sp. BOM4]|nr:hypothetical protein [Christiangramia bathymodioli]